VARALTNSPEISKDEALLSPDFTSVAYLKGNDLYLTDLSSSQETVSQRAAATPSLMDV